MADLYPTPTNITGIGGLFQHANSILSGIFGAGMMLVIFVGSLLLLMGKGYKTSDSVTLSSAISFILGSLLWVGGVLQEKYLIITLVLLIGSIIWQIFDSN